jgi:hypothetical protein
LAPIGGTEDFAWDPSVPGGRILIGSDAKINAYVPGPAMTIVEPELIESTTGVGSPRTIKPDPVAWTTVADFSSAGIGKISRLTATITGGHLLLAFVAEPVAK